MFFTVAIIFLNAAIISRKLAIILLLNGRDYLALCGDFLRKIGGYIALKGKTIL